MTAKSLCSCRGVLVTAGIVLGIASVSLADYVQSVVVSPNSSLTVVRNDPSAVPGTFLWINNPSLTDSWSGRVAWTDGAVSGLTDPPGYKLFDTTLTIKWDNPWATSLPWPIYGRGIGYTQRQLNEKRTIPARLLVMGRLDRERVWAAGQRKIRQLSRAEFRRVSGPMDRQLGHYGVDTAGQYAWAVVDQPGRYVLGAVPEPSTLVLLGCAVACGAVAIRLRRRRGT
jgi:hypothetical protein